MQSQVKFNRNPEKVWEVLAHERSPVQLGSGKRLRKPNQAAFISFSETQLTVSNACLASALPLPARFRKNVKNEALRWG